MTPAPFYSVIIPVYNRAHLLRAALDSVLAQTEQDFEIVVVDDGSIDDPGGVVEAVGDPRIRFLRQCNRGSSHARNTGIDIARGQFLAFLDSDDEFLPGHLATMRGIVEGTTNVVGYARMIVDRGQGRTFLKAPRAIVPGEHMATYLMCDRGFVQTSTLVVERNLAMRIRYDELLGLGDDTDFAIRLFAAGCRFVMAETPGAVWHDTFDPNRASAGRKGAELMAWLERIKPAIPPQAYHGARGWMIAKGVATQNPLKAFRLYVTALRHGCYRPRLAAVIFLQIFLPDAVYRRIADQAITLLRGQVWSRAEQRQPVPAE